MTNLVFNAFTKQSPVLKSKSRFIGAFAGKRGGKTEVGALWGIVKQETRPGYLPNGIDPYLGIIAAPTEDMLGRLSWKKFMAYARPCGMIKKDWKRPKEMVWHDSKDQDESIIYGISADNPARLEGLKANWIWIDEVFQVKEQFFLECLARVSDSEGYILCTGSLGVQFVNPKQHWAYKYFKEQIDKEFECFEWSTSDNPYYPKKEIERNRALLDKKTFQAMFEIRWDIAPKNAVYDEMDDRNIVKGLRYNYLLPVICVVDWGWAHPMACGIFQYDKKKDEVYLIEEMIKSKVKLSGLLDWIRSREYPIDKYICDVAGNQEREQSGKSNIRWFKEEASIKFKSKRSSIVEGISVVRSYVLNSYGKARFFISDKCTQTIDGMKRYKYPEKDGIIQNENPVKKDDDAVDMVRYYFIHEHDPKTKNMKPITASSYM